MRIKYLIAIIIAIVMILIIRQKDYSPPSYELDTYIVQAGDTAWGIMSRNNTANKDIRELIYYMEQDNGINAGNLQIGQELKIRIYENKKTDVNAVTSTPDKRIENNNAVRFNSH